MKKTLTSLAVGLLFAVTALGALPTYKTLSAYGNSTAGALVYFPSDPNSQIRLIYVNWGDDKAGNKLNFYTGVTAYSQALTNAASSSVTNAINSTNGLAANASLILEHGGVPYPATLSSLSTNAAGQPVLVLGSGGWGVNASVGDNIYLMSTATSIPIGVGTNAFAGDALFTGNYGRPVEVTIDTATATNSLYSVSAHYDSQSQ